MVLHPVPPSERTVIDKTYTILAEQLGLEWREITPDAELMQDLEADSLDVIEIAMALEEEFGVTVDDADLEMLIRVRDVTTYIFKRVQKGR
jgi:acyl carrier protein